MFIPMLTHFCAFKLLTFIHENHMKIVPTPCLWGQTYMFTFCNSLENWKIIGHEIYASFIMVLKFRLFHIFTFVVIKYNNINFRLNLTQKYAHFWFKTLLVGEWHTAMSQFGGRLTEPKSCVPSPWPPATFSSYTSARSDIDHIIHSWNIYDQKLIMGNTILTSPIIWDCC